MRPADILTEAASLVTGERAHQHGDYSLLHARAAELWSAFLDVSVKPSDVAFCMTLLKVARQEVGHKNSDDGVDASAYTALWAALSEDA
tara:strand:+ start:1170 stop:1436 length:267 start_codon:yes stop_codon:yes gene_type:complete